MTLFKQIATMGHEQVMFCHDTSTSLKAIIAIHDTTLGPALGGCRMWDYASEDEAVVDVLRLSRGMTYKAAISGLNLGGGKAVIIGDPKKLKSEAFFRAFGRFVNNLGGRYITAEDVNIRVSDMEHVATETRYVTGISSRVGGSGDPSPVTALGVFHGIRASVKHKYDKNELRGIKVAVQGCGSVGLHLCELLYEAGAQLLVADIDETKVRQAAERFKAQAVDFRSIHAQSVEVFAPCALGGILNGETIDELKAQVVAGGANNQLLDESIHGELVRKKGVLYAPDYVINAGGLMNVYQELIGYDANASRKRAAGIYETLLMIYSEAEREKTTTIQASNKIADYRINSVRKAPQLRNSMDNQPWSR